MKDYIVLTSDTVEQNDDNSWSWDINQSYFKGWKQNDRLIIKLISCALNINNGAVDCLPGITIMYCNINSSNITTDSGQNLLGFVNSDVKLFNGNYRIYTTSTDSDIEIYTNQFYKFTAWPTASNNTTILDTEELSLILEVSYYQN